ncbi:MAG: hypothetical protein OXG44_22055 [Gammaproteobacteria bacterium]|nr:hypothetical protein [Gammaproteobacteria bacterium]
MPADRFVLDLFGFTIRELEAAGLASANWYLYRDLRGTIPRSIRKGVRTPASRNRLVALEAQRSRNSL